MHQIHGGKTQNAEKDRVQEAHPSPDVQPVAGIVPKSQAQRAFEQPAGRVFHHAGRNQSHDEHKKGGVPAGQAERKDDQRPGSVHRTVGPTQKAAPHVMLFQGGTVDGLADPSVQAVEDIVDNQTLQWFMGHGFPSQVVPLLRPLPEMRLR